ncbi:unnamed protein product [Prorocentrum cordatum]|uniref:Major facilitator superfamily (MFS) profile domain-containing protein n=1 Tax=Prorocentrum cordatum TaxID=2364126 RepID=A0ABN9V751_9DINO|nr:unnamed protein product [Polarella glacialis]
MYPVHRLVVWALAPAVPCLVFGLFSRAAWHESPHFLAAQRRGRDLVSSLNVMFEMNCRPDCRIVLDRGIHAEPPEEEPSREAFVKVLSEYPYWFHWRRLSAMSPPPAPRAGDSSGLEGAPLGRCDGTVATSGVPVLWCELVSGGMLGFWPQVFADVDNDFGSRELPGFKLLVAAMVAIPGALMALFLVSIWDACSAKPSEERDQTEIETRAEEARRGLPRRATLAASATVCGGGALMLLRLGPSPWMGITGLVLMQLLSPSWFVVVLVYPAEVFPTQIRASALSGSYFLGLCGAEMVQFMTSFVDNTWCLVIYACAAFVSALLVQLLPETNDSELLNNWTPESLTVFMPPYASDCCDDDGPETGYGSFAEGVPVAKGCLRETSASHEACPAARLLGGLVWARLRVPGAIGWDRRHVRGEAPGGEPRRAPPGPQAEDRLPRRQRQGHGGRGSS